MLSSLNAFGGLSAAELLTLFGANSTSSAPSSSATSTSADQSASTAVSAADANDPTRTIKDILADAQMEQRSAAPSAGESASSAMVAAAYAEQAGNGYAFSFEGANGSATWAGSEQSFAATVQAETPAGESAVNVAGESFQASSFVSVDGGVSFHTGVIAASISTASLSHAASGAISNLAAGQVDAFYLSDSVGAQSAAIGFQVGGLGQPEALPSLDWASSDAICSVGQGDMMESFSIAVSNGDSTQTTSCTIGGVNMAQAQQLEASFENAAPTSGNHEAVAETETGVSADSNCAWFAYTLNYYSGASITLSAQISGGWTPAG